ncbi:MAG: hypothetical protein R3C44_22120 [Chloroflexota bacterium]
MLNRWLGLRGEMPVALGRLGIVVGMLSLVVFVTSSRAIQATLPRPAFNSVMSVVTPLWLVSLPVWAVWTGAWLWGKGRGLNHSDEDLSGFQNLTGLGKELVPRSSAIRRNCLKADRVMMGIQFRAVEVN